jgi:hypothetical protein
MSGRKSEKAEMGIPFTQVRRGGGRRLCHMGRDSNRLLGEAMKEQHPASVPNQLSISWNVCG